MPKDPTITSVLVLGSGPIVIGQACEFDYSGTQGCKALQEEGIRITLLNSNPATVMTDPGFSARTYMEPLNIHMASAVIRREKPDALLPTLGGQTALNLAMELHKSGILEEYGVRMIGAGPESIEIAENRERFRDTMLAAGLDLPKSGFAENLETAEFLTSKVGFPAIVRPSYTLGGAGGGVAYNLEEFRRIAAAGLAASPISQILIEESVLGWKEIELEVIRDKADNAVVICGIENLDPMGVHTGDSITVAPIQTLSDVEYQALRADALTVVRAVGVDTGGCNIQFAVDPKTGRRVVIEMNPRVSRSSALASKAVGYPIARVAAKLALGYTLDELRNVITGGSACFEPAVDYCVVKVPRFNFEKFPGSEARLGLQMHSVGEVMALGGNFREALQKALRGLETGLSGLEPLPNGEASSRRERLEILRAGLHHAGPNRLQHLYEALTLGMSLDDANAETGIDFWFLEQIQRLAHDEAALPEGLAGLSEPGDPRPEALAELRRLKAQGFGDRQICRLLAGTPAETSEEALRELRRAHGITPRFRAVDTCAGEFMASTPYFYSTFDSGESDSRPAPPERVSDNALKGPGGHPLRKVMILGGGPNRIGQGVEFDYCCVRACQSLRGAGVITVMVNSNPETVSTDFDMSDILYFESLTAEDILAVAERERPDGVIVQLGGQTPLNLAATLERAGVPILGTKPAGIALAEDRAAFGNLVESLGIPEPARGMAGNEEMACRTAAGIGFPVMVRPSFVLGGRAMRVIHNESELRAYMREGAAEGFISPSSPVLVDKFLEDAVEVDVDALCDGERVTIAAIMEHIEQAGIHSGDSCCSIPTHTLSDKALRRIRSYTRKLGPALGTKGLLNVQYAVRDDEVFVIEANPRASRTVPFVSKAVGRDIAGLAALVMAGKTLSELGFTEEPRPLWHSVKEAVIPFHRFPGTEIALGPEMRSTGEVMGIDRSFGMAFLKAQSAASSPIPYSGAVVLSVTDADKEPLVPLAKRLEDLGFLIHATAGTAEVLSRNGIAARPVMKIGPKRPHLLDMMISRQVQMIVNTVSGPASARDAGAIRSRALAGGITLLTTLAALRAAVEGLETQLVDKRSVAPLQDYYAGCVEGKKLC